MAAPVRLDHREVHASGRPAAQRLEHSALVLLHTRDPGRRRLQGELADDATGRRVHPLRDLLVAVRGTPVQPVADDVVRGVVRERAELGLAVPQELLGLSEPRHVARGEQVPGHGAVRRALHPRLQLVAQLCGRLTTRPPGELRLGRVPAVARRGDEQQGPIGRLAEGPQIDQRSAGAGRERQSGGRLERPVRVQQEQVGIQADEQVRRGIEPVRGAGAEPVGPPGLVTSVHGDPRSDPARLNLRRP